MKPFNKMTNADVFHWLEKTLTSMENAKSENRKCDLVDRYDDLKEEANARNIWNAWCDRKSFCPTHTGWDCFA